MSHEPQWLALLLVSTQAWPHWVSQGWQVSVQLPPEQTWPPWHVTPHAPQLAASLCTSTHAPPHSVRPAKHWQVPPPQN